MGKRASRATKRAAKAAECEFSKSNHHSAPRVRQRYRKAETVLENSFGLSGRSWAVFRRRRVGHKHLNPQIAFINSSTNPVYECNCDLSTAIQQAAIISLIFQMP